MIINFTLLNVWNGLKGSEIMIYIYFSPWDDEYFLSRTEIATGYILTQITDEQGVYKTMQELGANKEQIDKMFENLN